MKKYLILLILLAAKFLTFGQTGGCPEYFKAYNSSGQEVSKFCVGQKIRFKSCRTNSQADKEYYDFDKGNGISFPDTVKNFTFSQAGTFTITQLINTGQISQKERTFEVLATPQPNFTVLSCAQNRVSITITDNVYDNFSVDFGNGIKTTLLRGNTFSYQYPTAASSYTITVTGTINGASCSNSKAITVNALPSVSAPNLSEVKINKYGLKGSYILNIGGMQPQYLYIIDQMSATTITTPDTIKNPATTFVNHTLANKDTRNFTWFQVRVTDRCGTNLNLQSVELCSLPLTANVSNQGITLNWPTYPDLANLTRYELYRDGQLARNIIATDNSFQDKDVVCGIKYCYNLKAILKNNRQSSSNDTCVIAVSSQTPIAGKISSTFTPENKIELKFTAPANISFKNITYQKSSNTNNNFTNLSSNNQTTYLLETGIDLNNPSCFAAFYRNECDLTSEISNKTCPVYLIATLNENNTATLTWTPYVGFAGVITYAVEKLDNNGNILSNTPVSGTKYTDANTDGNNQNLSYRIKATGSAPSEISYSNTVILMQQVKILIPNAFTPNGDELNDKFEVKGRFVKEYRMRIYDRWGKILWDNTAGWDGKINGRVAPVGAYPYNIVVMDVEGKQFIKTGTVTLLR